MSDAAWADPNAPLQESSALRSWASTSANIRSGSALRITAKAGLDHLCSVLHGDFLNIPAEDGSFDAAYHIEAMPHAPDKAAAYAEIFRVLRPGAVFAGSTGA